MEETPTKDHTLGPLLSWSALSHSRHSRTMRWYLLFFVVILGFALYGAYTGNWTFAILMLLCGLFYPLLHDHIPPEKRIEIYPKAFRFEDIIIRWEDCTGFWILFFQNYAELHIEYIEGKRRKEVKIQNGSVDPLDIRLRLAEFIPELPDRGEHLLDKIIRLCKL